MSELPKRIHGTEMEWSISNPKADPKLGDYQAGHDVLARHKNAYLAGIPHSKEYLGNGARLYLDIGDHLEYATPESDSFLGTVANEIAGERIIRKVLNTIVVFGEIIEDTSHFTLNKRVIDERNVTWGYHESQNTEHVSSITTPSGELDPNKLALLGVHSVARNILFGAGVIKTNGRFALAQKVPNIGNDFGIGTTRNQKTIVNLRDEPLADKRYNRRIHNITADPNMSPWATRVRLASNSMVLRLIEQGEYLEDLRFAKSLHKVGKDIANDINFERAYQLKNGTYLTAMEIEQKLIDNVRRIENDLPDEELWALDEWEKAISDLNQDPKLLNNRADWAGKLHAILKYREKYGLDWKSDKLRVVDRQWDRIDPDGIGMKMREAVWSEWMPDEELIKDRDSNPPQTTRGKIRGECIQKLFKKRGVELRVNWDGLDINGSLVPLEDPRSYTNARVDERVQETKRRTKRSVA